MAMERENRAPRGNGRKRRKTRDLFQAFVQKIPSVFILPRAGAADTPKAACGAVAFLLIL